MSAEAAVMSRTFRVGSRTVTLTVPRPQDGRAVCMALEWSPDMPRCLNSQERHQYREGRNATIAELAKELGLNILVAEI